MAVVVQSVEALRYEPESRGFDFGIFLWHNPSGRTMALGSNQPLAEMSTRNVSWGKGGRCEVLTTLPPSSADCLEIWDPQPPGTLRACTGIALPLVWHCEKVRVTDKVWSVSRGGANSELRKYFMNSSFTQVGKRLYVGNYFINYWIYKNN